MLLAGSPAAFKNSTGQAGPAKLNPMSPIRPPELLSLELSRHRDLQDWLLLQACFRRHETLPHASAGWILLHCPQGLEAFEAPGWQGPVPAGSLLRIPPELVHRDRAGWLQSCQILALYVPAAALPPAGLTLIQDPATIAAFTAWCEAFKAGADGLPEALYTWATTLPAGMPLVESVPAALPSLDRLARRLGLSKAAALRAFKRRWGCTPDQYRRQRQLRQAAELLLQGKPVVEAALAAGFWDQSHLSRHFIAVYGVSPGEFRMRNSVQDDQDRPDSD